MQLPDDDAWSHESQGRSSEHEGNKKKRIRIAVVVVDAVFFDPNPIRMVSARENMANPPAAISATVPRTKPTSLSCFHIVIAPKAATRRHRAQRRQLTIGISVASCL